MKTAAYATKSTRGLSPNPKASYFGLVVEVIDLMNLSSLIRYEGREFVVSTDDLEVEGQGNVAA
jgi:hypothetical protein